MKPKTAVKLTADALMTACLLFLSGYQFFGNTAHEWVGVCMLLLFILHHILNIGWHKRLFSRKYTLRRAVISGVDILLFIAMLLMMFSGMVMSRSVFSFLDLGAAMSVARRLHILGAYWGFLLMSVHLGLHWNTVLSAVAKPFSLKPSRPRQALLFFVSLTVAVYGVYVFFSRGFPTYLFLRSEFVFLNFDEPILLFYIDYLALMGLCVFIAHYGGKLISRRKAARS